MSEKPLERRLFAILYADVAGYVNLTEADESGTHKALTHALGLLTTSIEAKSGDVVHTAGDAVLARFPTVAQALSCAVQFQNQIDSSPAAGPIRFRIGIHVGDVIVDKDEVYGEGVNTAVRLQDLAQPGGICISEAVRDLIGRKLPLAYEFLGEQRLKNMSEPVRAYRALLESKQTHDIPEELRGKPSVAVLPFQSFSDDSPQEYFADGITEDIIRELCRFHGIDVIAHNSSFIYKGRAAKVQDVAKELGVDYVVEGSVRSAGTQMRITAQLIEAASGYHIWAERYDTEFQQVFAIQDDIVRRIVSTLAGKLHVASGEHALRRRPEWLHVYHYVLRGQALTGAREEPNDKARYYFDKAISFDARCARAYCGSALTYVDDWMNGWHVEREQFDVAFERATHALSLDDSDSKTHWVMGTIRLLRCEHGLSEDHLKRANTLNPNDADVFAAKTLLLTFCGRPKEAASELSTAIRLNPFYPPWYGWVQGAVQYAAEQYDEAISSLTPVIERQPQLLVARQLLCAALVQAGKPDDARAHVQEMLNRESAAFLWSFAKSLPYESKQVHQRYLDTLSAAGVPNNCPDADKEELA